MNLFSHRSGYTLTAVLLMSVWLAEPRLAETTFKFSVNIGDRVIFRIPNQCFNSGYLLMKHGSRMMFADLNELGVIIYNSHLSAGDCSEVEETICLTYSVKSYRDFGHYYLLNKNTSTPCPITSYLITGSDGQYPVSKSVTTRAVNPGVVSANPSSVNILSTISPPTKKQKLPLQQKTDEANIRNLELENERIGNEIELQKIKKEKMLLEIRLLKHDLENKYNGTQDWE